MGLGIRQSCYGTYASLQYDVFLLQSYGLYRVLRSDWQIVTGAIVRHRLVTLTLVSAVLWHTSAFPLDVWRSR